LRPLHPGARPDQAGPDAAGGSDPAGAHPRIRSPPGRDLRPMTTATTTEVATTDAAESTTVEILGPDGWLPVCTLGRLSPGRGVAALLPDGAQAALFTDRAGRAYAIGNRDPFTGAQV